MKTQSNKLLMKEVAKWCMILASMFVFASATLAAQGNPGIAPSTSNITDVKTYADLGAEWWQWIIQIPEADSPLGDLWGAPDDMGMKCRMGQRGPVWFLASTLGYSLPGPENQIVRHCEIPGGKALFFPVINAGFFSFYNDDSTAEELRAGLDLCDTSSIRNLTLTIDGVPVARPEKYYTSAKQSPLFMVQLPTNNVWGYQTIDPSNEYTYLPYLLFSPSVHKGFYYYLKPLATGNHTIEWTATWDCDFDRDEEWDPVPYSENIKYELNVLKGLPREN